MRVSGLHVLPHHYYVSATERKPNFFVVCFSVQIEETRFPQAHAADKGFICEVGFVVAVLADLIVTVTVEVTQHCVKLRVVWVDRPCKIGQLVADPTQKRRNFP